MKSHLHRTIFIIMYSTIPFSSSAFRAASEIMTLFACHGRRNLCHISALGTTSKSLSKRACPNGFQFDRSRTMKIAARSSGSGKGYYMPPEILEVDDDDDAGGKSKTFREDFQGTRVFVEGLPQSASWQDVKDHFRVAGEVVFASVSVDAHGDSKGCGIVQFETVDDAKHAIKIMRDHPLEGSDLYVRPDRQEQSKRGKAFENVSGNRKRGKQWRCANEDNSSLISAKDRNYVEHMISLRDKARIRKDFDAADKIRDDLKYDFGVHLDDRLKLWWNAIDGMNAVPDTLAAIKGDGNWKGPRSWRQIPTTPENDACVNADLVEGLLKQRDIARLEKDFKTADMLLDQARTSPDGDLELRIHDESRTWRIWTKEAPPKRSNAELRESGPYDKCIAYIREVDPSKESEVTALLKKFPGREWNILKKLRQRYSSD